MGEEKNETPSHLPHIKNDMGEKNEACPYKERYGGGDE